MTTNQKTSTAKKAATKKTAGKKKKVQAKKATAVARARSGSAKARAHDVLILDSMHVGTPPRQGEILEVMHGETSITYRVRWEDGHESQITPMSGAAHIAPAGSR